MKKTSLTNERARQILKTHALNEIGEVSDFSKYYNRVFCMDMK